MKISGRWMIGCAVLALTLECETSWVAAPEGAVSEATVEEVVSGDPVLAGMLARMDVLVARKERVERVLEVERAKYAQRAREMAEFYMRMYPDPNGRPLVSPMYSDEHSKANGLIDLLVHEIYYLQQQIDLRGDTK